MISSTRTSPWPGTLVVIVSRPRLALRSKTPSPFSGISWPAAETLPLIATSTEPALTVLVAAWATGSTAFLTLCSAPQPAAMGVNAQTSRTGSRRRMAQGYRRAQGVTSIVRPGPDAQRAPAPQQLEQLVADDRAPPALQRAHLGVLAGGADRRDDPLQVGARGQQLVGELGLGGAGAHERLAEGDERRVLGIGRRRAVAVDRDRLALAPALDGLEDRAAAAAQRALVEAADLGQALERRGPALGHLDQGRVGEHAGHRAVGLARGVLAPAHELVGHGALRGLQRVHARQSVEDRLGLALVGGVLERAALLQRPVQPPAVAQRLLQRIGELEQVQHVLARVADLLGAQRAGVPARERRALAQAHADHLVQQGLVAELGAQARRSRRRPECRRSRAARWTTRGAAGRRPGARRAGRSGCRGRPAGPRAAPGRTPRSADRGPRRARRRRSRPRSGSGTAARGSALRP